MLGQSTMRRVALGAPLGLIALALAGCGYGSHHSYGVAGAAKTKLTATETEFRIQLSQTSVRPGPVTLVALNKGKLPHSLEVDGPGVSSRRIAGTIPPGGSKQLTVTLRKGSYEVYCPVPGHKQQGMVTHLTVGGAGGGGSGGSMTTGGGGGGY